jgi:hypothetical protein
MRSGLCVSRWLGLCIQLLCIPGCSFWAVRGPNASVSGGGDCSTSVVAPVVDSVLAASFVGIGVAGVAAPSCNAQASGASAFGSCFIDFSGAEHGAGAGLIALGVLEAVAATYGAAKVSACHQAKKELEATSRPAPALRIGTDAASDPPRRPAVSALDAAGGLVHVPQESAGAMNGGAVRRAEVHQ